MQAVVRAIVLKVVVVRKHVLDEQGSAGQNTPSSVERFCEMHVARRQTAKTKNESKM